jgi:hypothetical protein
MVLPHQTSVLERGGYRFVEPWLLRIKGYGLSSEQTSYMIGQSQKTRSPRPPWIRKLRSMTLAGEETTDQVIPRQMRVMDNGTGLASTIPSGSRNQSPILLIGEERVSSMFLGRSL